MTDTSPRKGTLMINAQRPGQPEMLGHAAAVGNANAALDTALQQARTARAGEARLKAALQELLRQLDNPPVPNEYGQLTHDPRHVLYSQIDRASVPRSAFKDHLRQHPGTSAHAVVPTPDWWRLRSLVQRVLGGADVQTATEDLHAEAVRAFIIAPADQARANLYNTGQGSNGEDGDLHGIGWKPQSDAGAGNEKRHGAERETAGETQTDQGTSNSGADRPEDAEPDAAKTMLLPPVPPGPVSNGQPANAPSPVRSGDTATMPPVPGEDGEQTRPGAENQAKGGARGPLALTGARPATPARRADGDGDKRDE